MTPQAVLSAIQSADAGAVRSGLAADHPGCRAWACHGVVVLKLDPSLLAAPLADPSWVVRAAACRACGQRGQPTEALMRGLQQALGDAHPSVQRLAVQAVGKLGLRSAVSQLLDVWHAGADAALASEIVVCLGRLGERAAIPARFSGSQD